MRVLLVMPTPFENGRLGLENVVWLSEPVALTSVGAAILDAHEVRVLDMRLEDEEALARTLSSFRPDVMRDWLARPASEIPQIFGNRPVAVIGASPAPNTRGRGRSSSVCRARAAGRGGG